MVSCGWDTSRLSWLVYIHVYAYTCICIYTCTCIPLMYTQILLYMYNYTDVHTYIHVCVPYCTCTYIITYIHVRICMQVWESLVENPAFSSDRDNCFRWFAKVRMPTLLPLYVYMYVYITIISRPKNSITDFSTPIAII